MRATAVPRAEPAAFSPVYQDTVLAGVPAISDDAVLNGGPPTRSGAGLALTLGPKPSAANAVVLELVSERLTPSAPCNSMAPLLPTVEEFLVPVIESILASRVCTLSVMLSWLPVAPDATKV